MNSLNPKIWNDYISKLSRINNKAAQMMDAYIQKHGYDDTEAIIRYAYQLCERYGSMGASVAADMYDQLADMLMANVPTAIPAETATIEDTAKAVNWSLRHSPSQLSSIVYRLTKQASADTMIQNAARDGAYWAWVPNGDTCPFCLTLASRGWQKASKDLINGHASHIHQNCDCTFAISFRERDRQKYDRVYDPDKYLEQYNNADGTSSKDKINALRRQNYTQNREKIREQQRISYKNRKLRDDLTADS